MKKIRHSKYRNTGILHEMLVRQMTSDIMNAASSSSSYELISKYFGKGTELSKELELYQTILSENLKTEATANLLLTGAVRLHKKLDAKKVANEKYKLVRDIKSYFNDRSFFEIRVPEYRLYAAIHTLFENSESIDSESLQGRDILIEHILSPREEKRDSKISVFEQLDSNVRNVAFELLLQKFNKKYENFSNDQKTLLKTYISTPAGAPELREYLITEHTRLRREISQRIVKIKDPATRIKVTETVNLLNEDVPRILETKFISNTLKYQELLNELKLL